MKKILIDANPVVPYFALGKITGIGRTCMELIKGLDAVRDTLPFEIELYTQNLKGISAKRLNTGFKTRHAYLRNTPFHNKLSKALRLREMLSRYDLQHITHNCETVKDPSRCIVTVHDAFFMKLDVKEFDYARMRESYPTFIRSARHIITCSEFSKKDIMETMQVEERKISVIPWGIDHETFFPADDPIKEKEYLRERFGISSPYFLSVSCDSGRKRTHELIKAWKSLENPKNDLVLVWNNPPTDIQETANKTNRIHILKRVSNEELRYLYNCATASVNPTAYEGFGLPVLEAMACGCVPVTCHNSSLPEVGKDAAIYVPEPIADHLPSVLCAIDNDKINLAWRIRRGLEIASEFTWQKTVERTVHVYDNILKSM